MPAGTLIKIGLDPLSNTALISLGSGIVAIVLLPFVGIPVLKEPLPAARVAAAMLIVCGPVLIRPRQTEL